MRRTVLINAGPWLPVPPDGYGGIEAVLATLIPELRRRGIRVVLATVAESSIPVDRQAWAFETGQFERLGGPYNQVVGTAHAHMARVIEELEADPSIDLVHDHQEIVGAASLAARCGHGPPALQTLHWNLRKDSRFYELMAGRPGLFFNAVSERQAALAPPALRRSLLGAVPLGVRVEDYPYRPRPDSYFTVLSRITPDKGCDVAARLCRRLGRELRIAGPVGGVGSPEALAARLEDPHAALHANRDVRHYLDAVKPHEGHGVRWLGNLGGREKTELLAGARALLMPIRWEEPGATVAIEALACGTPVLGMRRGALVNIVEHGATGFLAGDEDELAGYLDRVDELDPNACRRAAEERFSAATMGGRYVELYEEVLRRARMAPGRARRLETARRRPIGAV
jgi:glycosyltransferase involved in cell wall biosynthesis